MYAGMHKGRSTVTLYLFLVLLGPCNKLHKGCLLTDSDLMALDCQVLTGLKLSTGNLCEACCIAQQDQEYSPSKVCVQG